MYLNPQTGIRVAGEISSAYAVVVKDIDDNDNLSQILAGQMEISNSSAAFIDMKNDHTIDKTMRLSVIANNSAISATENLNISGGAANLVRLQRVYRGYSVTQGSSQLHYEFANALPDANYSVFVTPNWPTICHVSGRTANGFYINFGTAAPAAAEVELMIVGQPS